MKRRNTTKSTYYLRISNATPVGLETGRAGDVRLVDAAKKLAEVDDLLRGLGERDDLCLRRGERDALLLRRSPRGLDSEDSTIAARLRSTKGL